MPSRSRFVAVVALVPVLLALLLLLPGLGVLVGRADDVPDDVRDVYEKALEQFRAGDLGKAYSTICRGKSKNPASVDYWELYVRIWRELGKPEDVLWEKTIRRVEARNPKSDVFDVLRARLAPDPAERIRWLEAALEKDPDDLDAQLLLAQSYVRQGDDGKAEKLLDEVLARHADDERALVAKGELSIASGFSRSALDYARNQLADHDLPGLHDLAARALVQLAENDEDVWEQAEVEARKAVAGRPDAAFVVTLADVLDERGKEKEAMDLLAAHLERTHSPRLGARLGAYDFRSGHYAEAVKRLNLAPGDDTKSCRLLALAEARMGHEAEARRALTHLLSLDPEAHRAACSVLEDLGDLDGARKAATAMSEDEGGAIALSRVDARRGDAAAVREAVADEARGESRAAEERLTVLVLALLYEKLGPRRGSLENALRDACHALARQGVERPDIPEFEPVGKAHSFGFMQRLVSYSRCRCGRYLEFGEFEPLAIYREDTAHGKVVLATVTHGTCSCRHPVDRQFPFNPIPLELPDTEEELKRAVVNAASSLSPNQDDWEAAQEAFGEGAAALVDGKWIDAAVAFERVVEKEPSWARARLFHAAANDLGGQEPAAGATEALDAVKSTPEDEEGLELAACLVALAGRDGKEIATSYARAVGTFLPRN